MEHDQLIGVDIGGTAIKLGRFRCDGSLLQALEIPTPQPAMPGGVTMAIAEAVQELDPDRRATRMGIGHPGPSDRWGRIARVAINLPGWLDVPLADWLEPKLDRRVTTANDANCALVGEHWLGAAQQAADVLLLTLGTGVGGGVLLAGELFTGRSGAAPEPGLIGINPDGPPCHSGNRGSLEQYCSIAGLGRLSPLNPAVLCEQADAGEAGALAIWRSYGRLLGIGLSSLIYQFTPELVLVGGGLSAASHHFLPAAWEEITQRVSPVSREGLAIERCQLGNGAGRLGAAKLALDRFPLERVLPDDLG